MSYTFDGDATEAANWYPVALTEQQSMMRLGIHSRAYSPVSGVDIVIRTTPPHIHISAVTGGFLYVYDSPANTLNKRGFISASKTGFSKPTYPIVRKLAGNMDWTNGKRFISWNNKSLSRYSIVIDNSFKGNELFENGSVVFTLPSAIECITGASISLIDNKVGYNIISASNNTDVLTYYRVENNNIIRTIPVSLKNTPYYLLQGTLFSYDGAKAITIIVYNDSNGVPTRATVEIGISNNVSVSPSVDYPFDNSLIQFTPSVNTSTPYGGTFIGPGLQYYRVDYASPYVDVLPPMPTLPAASPGEVMLFNGFYDNAYYDGALARFVHVYVGYSYRNHYILHDYEKTVNYSGVYGRVLDKQILAVDYDYKNNKQLLFYSKNSLEAVFENIYYPPNTATEEFLGDGSSAPRQLPPPIAPSNTYSPARENVRYSINNVELVSSSSLGTLANPISGDKIASLTPIDLRIRAFHWSKTVYDSNSVVVGTSSEVHVGNYYNNVDAGISRVFGKMDRFGNFIITGNSLINPNEIITIAIDNSKEDKGVKIKNIKDTLITSF